MYIQLERSSRIYDKNHIGINSKGSRLELITAASVPPNEATVMKRK